MSLIQVKEYTQENSTAEEVEAIRDCIYVLESGIIYYEEVPIQSAFSIDTMVSKLHELEKEIDSYVMLVDLTKAHRPNAETRYNLKKMFASDKLVYASLFTEKNKMLNIAAKFVLSSIVGKNKFQVVKKKGIALEIARNAVRK